VKKPVEEIAEYGVGAGVGAGTIFHEFVHADLQ
jgi:hypothetical protein